VIPAWIPATLALLLVGLAVANRTARQPRRLFYWFFGTWVSVVIASRMNLYPYGFRHSLILAPVLITLMALGISFLMTRPVWRWLGAALAISLVVLALVSLPTQAVRNLLYPQSRWNWPEDNYNFRPVVEHWRAHRTPGDITYIYYQANPAFRYYLRLYGIDNSKPPGAWYVDCLKSTQHPYCNSEGVIYGKYLRNLPPDKKVESIYSSLPAGTNAFWMVFAAVYPGEMAEILSQLQGRYRIDQRFEGHGVNLYHFTQ
jgi:hypothetical protein